MSRNGTAQLNAFIWVLILLLVLIMCVEIAGLVLHGATTPTGHPRRTVRQYGHPRTHGVSIAWLMYVCIPARH